MVEIFDKTLSPRQLKQRHTFFRRSAGDNEEIRAIIFRESTVALSKICGDGKKSAVELIAEEVITPRQGFRECDDAFGKVESLLINLKILEEEGHSPCPKLSRRQVNR